MASFLGLSTESETAPFRRQWGWLLTVGILNIALGVLLYSMPIASTVGATFVLACVFMVAGIIWFVQALRLQHERGNAARFVQSLLAIVAGVVMFRYPEAGMMGLALTLSFYFFVSAAAHWILASTLKPVHGWNWGYISAVASFLLGAYIIATFPFSAVWIPGALLAIELVVSGVVLVAFAMTVRREKYNDLPEVRVEPIARPSQAAQRPPESRL